MKICTKCKQEKPLEAFGVNNQQTSGLHPSCKECQASFQKTRRQTIIVATDIQILCSTCKIAKSATEFPIDRNAKYGRRPNCKTCEALRKKEQYTERRLAKTDSDQIPRGCEICGAKFDAAIKNGAKTKHTPHWDHIHETEIFRGWLCHNCNSALGQFGENIRIIEAAVEYVRMRGTSPSRPLIK